MKKVSEDITRLIDVDSPNIRITEESRRNSTEYSRRVGCRGDVRTALGMYRTDEELEAYREKVLGMSFP